jgi:hypothetical protein
VATGKSEKALGTKWAEFQRGMGNWVVKLPASSLAGLPDWLLVDPLGISLVEAKLLQPRGNAFVPSQLTRAQRFFLEVVARHGGRSYVLVLGPESWFMMPVRDHVTALSRRIFDQLAEPY